MAGNDAGRESGAYLQVQTTTDSRAEAMELARAAVEARLAACGQVAGPVASTYWWNDELERAEEWFVFFKLPADRYEDLAAFIAERHSYDEPEILATRFVAGSSSFLAWIADETRPRDPDLPPDPDDADDPDDPEDPGDPSDPSDPDVPRPRSGGLPSTSDLPG